MNGHLDMPDIDSRVLAALAEDLNVAPEALLRPSALVLAQDVTSAAVVDADAVLAARVVARGAGVVCGLPVVSRVFEVLCVVADRRDAVECFPLVAEGAFVEPGEAVMEIEGPARVILAGERTALDFLMVLSGIATAAWRWQEIAGDSLTVVDTRKTYPGLRELSKYAVRVGGGTNHRRGLWDMVLIKDNHIAAAGSISAAVASAREAHEELDIQVEADSVEAAAEAARAGADSVLLDNMDNATLARAVSAVREAAAAIGAECLTEVSGGVTEDRLPALRSMLVDRVSASAITLAPPLDFALDATG